jgi:cell division protein FtsL
MFAEPLDLAAGRRASASMTASLAAQQGKAMSLDRVEKSFVITAMTGFLVLIGALVWLIELS